MAQGYAKTGRTWHNTDEPVPFPAYRCKATAQQKPGHTHHCRRDIDAEHEHKCICDFEWEKVS